MNILFSQPANITFEIPTGKQGDHHLHVSHRRLGWGLRGARKKLFDVNSALRMAREARRFEALVLCTVGTEAFLVSRFKRAFCPQTRLVCADILMPRPSRSADGMRTWLAGIDRFVCIRTGDLATLERRFGVAPQRCAFAYFPANDKLPRAPAQGDYLYAAGNAHRDWPLLLRALEDTPWRAILSPGQPIEIPPSLRE